MELIGLVELKGLVEKIGLVEQIGLGKLYIGLVKRYS